MLLLRRNLFLAVNVSLRWRRVLSPGFFASYWSAGFGIGPCFSLAEGLCKFYANTGGN
jgi:hypothetical protein